MKVLLSDLIGVEVVTQNTGKKVGHVHDAIFDPDTGKLLAVFVSSQRKKIIVAHDINSISTEKCEVREMDSVVDLDAVLRVEKIFFEGRKFRFNKVFTKKGEYLGKVVDVEIQIPEMMISAIYVSKKLMFVFPGPKRIISREEILEVKKHKIIVRESLKEVKIESKELLEATVLS